MAVLKEGSTTDVDNETSIMAVMIGASSAIHSLSSQVGRGLSIQDFGLEFLMRSEIGLLVTFLKLWRGALQHCDDDELVSSAVTVQAKLCWIFSIFSVKKVQRLFGMSFST